MKNTIPESKLKRTVVGGKTAVNVSGKVLRYLVKKPFLAANQREIAKHEFEEDYAREIFKGLVLLKGTALKIAQMLSFELDLIPVAVRKELEKSYNQVPPINKALVRKMIQNAFAESPETVFASFCTTAYAAASLGQVHLASDSNGRKLAVKVQYPGIGKAIENDLQLVRNLTRPTPYARFVLPVLEEIESKLKEEIDYLHEAENTSYFHQHLRTPGIIVPAVFDELSTRTVLTTEFLEGKTLDVWMAGNPCQEERDRIADSLNRLFLDSLLHLQCLHADPNPGNFIVMDNLEIGLVDFGCVKRYSREFIILFKEIYSAMLDGDQESYFGCLEKLNVIHTHLDADTKAEIYDILKKMVHWFGKLYESEVFDFGRHPDFILEGKKIMQETYRYKKFFQPNPHFVYLNRTNYGMIRIFEKLKARVRFINPHQWVVQQTQTRTDEDGNKTV